MKLKLVGKENVGKEHNQLEKSVLSRSKVIGVLVAPALAVFGAVGIQQLEVPAWLGLILCMALGSAVIECAVNNPIVRVKERLWWTVLGVRALVTGCSGYFMVGGTFAIGDLVLDPRAMLFFEGLTSFEGNSLGLVLAGSVIAFGVSPKLHVELFGARGADDSPAFDRLVLLGLWSLLGGVALVIPGMGVVGLACIAYRVRLIAHWSDVLVKFRPLDRLKVE